MSFLQGGVLLVLVATCLTQEDFSIDCKPDSVRVTWPLKLTQEQVQNPNTVLLGNCAPSSVNVDGVFFDVGYNDCLFEKVVFGDKIVFMNVLSYRPASVVPSAFYVVDCVFDRPALLSSMPSQTGIQGTSKDKPIFSLELMNDDFSGPAPSTAYTVGSMISIRASVAEWTGTPQQIFLDECIMTESPDPYMANETRTIIADEGCLLESKYGNATFLPREKPSEISLSITALGFADTEEVYLHCKLVSWDAQRFALDKKACHYSKEKQRWELLDDLSQNHLCTCCDSICLQRGRGLWQYVILGPITIHNKSSKHSLWKAAKGSSKGTFWLLTVFLPVVLLIATGALALSYYLCVWRGGRLGYRPSRDLLNKY